MGFSGVSSRVSSVAEFLIAKRLQPPEHEMRLADLNHGGARSGHAFVVLAVPPATAVPVFSSFPHPPLLQRSKTLGSFGTHFHLDVPTRSILPQPRFELMVVILA